MDKNKEAESKSGAPEPREALLLSDDSVLFESVQKALEEVGCLCRHARTIAEAFKVLGSPQMDYVLIDLAFQSGHPFSLKVKDTNRLASILYIATREEYLPVQKNLPKNYLGIFYKPFDREELVKVLLKKSLGLYPTRDFLSSAKKTPVPESTRVVPTASELKPPGNIPAPIATASEAESSQGAMKTPGETSAEVLPDMPPAEQENMSTDDLPDNYDELMSRVEKEEEREQKYIGEIEELRNQILVLRVERDATRLTFDKNREVLKKREEQIRERDETIRLLRSKMKTAEHHTAELEGREGHPRDFSSDELLMSRAHYLFRTSREEFNFEVAAAIIDDLERLLEKRGSKILSGQNRRDGEFALSLHSLNTAILAMTLAKESGLSNCKSAGWAALLHDVSKMNLSGGEYEKHPLESANWMNAFPLSSEVLQAIREHHEKIDGSGFPGGLREEEIDLLSRIVAVANAAEHALSALQFAPPAEDIATALNSPAGALDSKLVSLLLNLLKRPE